MSATRKKLLITLTLFLFGFGTFSVQIHADTRNALSPSYTDIQTAVLAASSGDTVIVPAGSARWHRQLTITKAIKLQGAGIGSTIITSGINDRYNTYMIAYQPTSEESSKIFEITGFTFDGNYTSGIFSASRPSDTIPITGLRIHDNKFLNGRSRAINLSGLEFGVFFKNQFQDNYIAISIIGCEGAGWAYPLTLGGVDYPFFEDNTFTQTVARGGFISETGRGGRIVFRHNTILNYGGSGGEVWDAHGVNGTYPNDNGTVSSEIYNNNVGLSASSRLFNHRGGKAIVFNNTVTGSPAYLHMTEYQGWSYCTEQGYPKYQQINDSFYFNNIVGGSPKDPSLQCTSGTCTSCNQYDSTYIQLGRDYWLPTSGLDTNKPKSCSDNTYYGATDTGKIYRCHPADTWTPIYTPYKYPHPLVAGTSDSISPPGNLRISSQ